MVTRSYNHQMWGILEFTLHLLCSRSLAAGPEGRTTAPYVVGQEQSVRPITTFFVFQRGLRARDASNLSTEIRRHSPALTTGFHC
jgi:hypothetical protein